VDPAGAAARARSRGPSSSRRRRTACHTYLGTGSSNLGAPDLTAIGTRNLGITFQVNHLKCPSCVVPGSPMPKFASLGDERLRQLAIFLESSKGKK